MRVFLFSAFIGVAAIGCLGDPAISSNNSGGSAGTVGTSGGMVGSTAGTNNTSGTASGPASGGGGAGGMASTTAGTNSTAGSLGSGGSAGSAVNGGAAGSGGVATGGGSGGSAMAGSAAIAGSGGMAMMGATFPSLRVDDGCGNLLGGNVCLHATKANDDGTSFTKMATATMGGVAGTMYQVKILVRGVVEPTHIQGGTVGTPAQFLTGGNRYADGTNESTYQQWRLTTSIPNQHYYLNVFTQGLSHVVDVINYPQTIPIGGGSTVTLDVYDGNAHEISNTVNKPPLSIDGIPGSVTSGQFVQIDVQP